MSPDLEQLVFDYLERTAKGEDDSVVAEELAAAHPESKERFLEALKTLRTSGLGSSARASGKEHPDRLGAFELERQVGAGGMGVVYQARQTGVVRPVALKVIRADYRYVPGARQRFQREIEIVGRLSHPNIVSIYAVGEEGDVPYCAMEYIPGASLSSAVRRLVGARVEDLTGSDLRAAVASASQDENPSTVVDPRLYEGTWVATCLRVVREVARALEHAHACQVLHRDVKPSNVMLTTGGRVVLLDFGLARLREGGDLTRSGSELGSMPYMAPEQAAGRTAEIDETTDIYGLGVLLYEMLALRPPFAGNQFELVRAAILQGNAMPLRKLNTAVPRDVEIVVARAMERDRQRRYESATALLRDLDNLLERRPIEARPSGILLRTDRLVRRRPAATLAVLASLLLFVGGPLVLAWVQSGHARELGGALTETEAHLDSALVAIGEILRPLSDEELVDSPGLQDLRVETYRQGLELIQRLEENRTGDARIQLERARLELGLGQVLVEQGKVDQGISLMTRASEGLEELHTMDPSREVTIQWIDGLHALALASAQLTRPVDVAEAFDRARDLCTDLEFDHPSDPDIALLHASLISSQAAYFKEQGRYDEAAEQMEHSAELALRVIALDPDLAEAHAMVAMARHQRAIVLQGTGGIEWVEDGVLELLEETVASYQLALELRPEDRDWQLQLARALVPLARAYQASDMYSAADECFAGALEALDDLRQRFPEVPIYALERLQALQSRALATYQNGDQEEGVDALTEVAEAHLDVLALTPEPSGPQQLQAVAALGNAASLLINLDGRGPERFERAETWVAAGLEILTLGSAETLPVQHREFEVFLYAIQSRLLAERGEFGEAIESLYHTEELNTGLNPRSDGIRGEAWAVVWHMLDEEDSRREVCRQGVVRCLERGFDHGLPSAPTLQADYILPFQDEPRLVEAAARQRGE